MYKFKKDDIIIITRTESPGHKEPVEHKRGMIFKVTENNEARPFVKPNLLEHRDQLGCVWQENAELLSSIPLDKICVHTKTKEQWDSVNTYLPPTTNSWKNSNFGRLLKDNVFSSDCTTSYIIDEYYVISYGNFIDYIVPMHFNSKPEPTNKPILDLSLYELITVQERRCSKCVLYQGKQGNDNCNGFSNYTAIRKTCSGGVLKLKEQPKIDDNRYPVKEYAVYDGTNGKQIQEWLNSNGGKRPNNQNFASVFYWVDKKNSHNYNNCSEPKNIPKGFVEHKFKSTEWWENLKEGDYFVCTYPNDKGYCAKTNHIYPFHSLGEKNIRYAPGDACDKNYARLATPEEAALCKANNNQPTPLDWKPEKSSDDRYPVKQYIKFTGDNADEVFEWLKANGSTRSDKKFLYTYYWIDLKYYYNNNNMCDHLSDIPEGFTEYKPQQKSAKEYTSTKEWALDNGYELRSEGCSKCDLRRPNGDSCSLFHIGHQMSCDSGPSGSFHKKKSHLVEAIQSLNMVGIHLGTPEEQLPINLVNVFRDPQSFDDKPDILIKPSTKRTLIQVQL